MSERSGINPDVPMILQVLHYYRFKDPLGVINAHDLRKNRPERIEVWK
ncbi:MAG: hypothetical protein ACQEQK_03410 [Thermodesulfobacteriota bacterium]